MHSTLYLAQGCSELSEASDAHAGLGLLCGTLHGGEVKPEQQTSRTRTRHYVERLHDGDRPGGEAGDGRQEEGGGLGLLGRGLGLVLGLDDVQTEQIEPPRAGQVGQGDQVTADLVRAGELVLLALLHLDLVQLLALLLLDQEVGGQAEGGGQGVRLDGGQADVVVEGLVGPEVDSQVTHV